MLKQRVVTAVLLVVLVLAAIFLLPPLFFTLFLAAAILAGAWEWSLLAGFASFPARGAYVLLFAVVLAASRNLGEAGLQVVLAGGVLWWLAACFLVRAYPRHSRTWGHTAVLALMGLLVLVPGWLTFLYLRERENYVILIPLLLAAVATADIGAYFTGRAFGRHKLAVRVSPNKTWEGFWGGVTACCLLIILSALVYSLSGTSPGVGVWLQLAVFSVLLGMASAVGDLLESMVKRYRDVKDSGNLLPGHGGMLDRIDGITAAAPVYALLVMNIGADLA